MNTTRDTNHVVAHGAALGTTVVRIPACERQRDAMCGSMCGSLVKRSSGNLCRFPQDEAIVTSGRWGVRPNHLYCWRGLATVPPRLAAAAQLDLVRECTARAARKVLGVVGAGVRELERAGWKALEPVKHLAPVVQAEHTGRCTTVAMVTNGCNHTGLCQE